VQCVAGSAAVVGVGLGVTLALGVAFGVVDVPEDVPASSTPPTESPAARTMAVIATVHCRVRRSR
jgi:hypothetical protein